MAGGGKLQSYLHSMHHHVRNLHQLTRIGLKVHSTLPLDIERMVSVLIVVVLLLLMTSNVNSLTGKWWWW